jgi:hypothetical protein
MVASLISVECRLPNVEGWAATFVLTNLAKDSCNDGEPSSMLHRKAIRNHDVSQDEAKYHEGFLVDTVEIQNRRRGTCAITPAVLPTFCPRNFAILSKINHFEILSTSVCLAPKPREIRRRDILRVAAPFGLSSYKTAALPLSYVGASCAKSYCVRLRVIDPGRDTIRFCQLKGFDGAQVALSGSLSPISKVDAPPTRRMSTWMYFCKTRSNRL